MEYTTITYVGKSGKGAFFAKIKKTVYEFEWQKGVGIGYREGEIRPEHARKIARWRDKKGKRIFILE